MLRRIDGWRKIAAVLVDRDGIVRWTNIEYAREGLAGFEKFPVQDDLLKAARTLGP